MGPPSYMRSVDRNVFMRRMTVLRRKASRCIIIVSCLINNYTAQLLPLFNAVRTVNRVPVDVIKAYGGKSVTAPLTSFSVLVRSELSISRLGRVIVWAPERVFSQSSSFSSYNKHYSD